MAGRDDRYSHGHHASVLRSHLWRTAGNSAAYLLPHLASGASILDVGCGPGNLTADLARHLGSGTVIGIDRVADIVDVARHDHLTSEGAPSDGASLSFQVDDAYELSFGDSTFDIVHAHQVLQHLTDPTAALTEWRRVLKPGGLLAVRDSDYGAMAWGPKDPVIEGWLDLYHRLTERNGAQADAGRYLAGWVRAAGFRDLVVSSSNWTFHAADDRSWWGGLWADRVVASEFGTQAVEYGLATPEELDVIAEAFRRWAGNPDGVCITVHGEVLARA